MQQFIYPAIFYNDEDEVKVYFPDLDISTSGVNYSEAFLFAKDLLRVYFLYVLANNLDFDFPSKIEDVKCEKGQKTFFIDAIISPKDVKEFKKTGKTR